MEGRGIIVVFTEDMCVCVCISAHDSNVDMMSYLHLTLSFALIVEYFFHM